MFRKPRPSGPSSPPRSAPSPLRRTAFFAGGLVCLWGALQLAPLPASRPSPEARPAAGLSAAVVEMPETSGASPVGAPVLTVAPEADPEAAAATPASVLPAPEAEEAVGVAAEVPAPVPHGRSEYRLFRPGNVLAFLLLAGGAAYAFVLHRKKRGPAVVTGTAPPMGVVGELALGPGHTLRLVRMHDEVLVLGVSAAGIALVHRYPYAPPEAGTADAAPALAFADVLRQFVPVAAHA